LAKSKFWAQALRGVSTPCTAPRTFNISFSVGIFSVEKDKLSSLKSSIDVASALFQFLSKICAAIGVLVLLLYCAQIGFFPKGLSLSDGLVFVFVVLAFAFVIVVGTLYGGFSMLWLFRLLDFVQDWRIRKWKARGAIPEQRPKGMRLPAGLVSWPLVASSSMVSALFFLAFWQIGKTKPDQADALYALVTGFLVTGYIVLLSFMRPLFDGETQKDVRQRKLLRTLAALSIPLVPLVFGSSEQLLAATMKIVALRHDNVAVELSTDNYSRLESASKAMGVEITSCPLAGGHVLVPHADVLWNGVGSRTLLRVTGEGPGHQLTMDADNSGVWILRTRAHVGSSTCG
jgi:hypothetical protein